jgi:hypothetical protein
MTMYSLRVLADPPDSGFMALDRSELSTTVIKDLQEHARLCGAYRLSDWAKARGLERHYVDNCWVRVQASGEQVLEFLRDLIGPDVAPIAGLDPSGAYLIEAEEF